MRTVNGAGQEPRAGAADQYLQRQVATCLMESAFTGLRKVGCEARDGVVTLHGRVSSFYLKQLATATAGKASGVRQVRNAIHVRPYVMAVVING